MKVAKIGDLAVTDQALTLESQLLGRLWVKIPSSYMVWPLSLCMFKLLSAITVPKQVAGLLFFHTNRDNLPRSTLLQKTRTFT